LSAIAADDWQYYRPMLYVNPVESAMGMRHESKLIEGSVGNKDAFIYYRYSELKMLKLTRQLLPVSVKIKRTLEFSTRVVQ